MNFDTTSATWYAASDRRSRLRYLVTVLEHRHRDAGTRARVARGVGDLKGDQVGAGGGGTLLDQTVPGHRLPVPRGDEALHEIGPAQRTDTVDQDRPAACLVARVADRDPRTAPARHDPRRHRCDPRGRRGGRDLA